MQRAVLNFLVLVAAGACGSPSRETSAAGDVASNDAGGQARGQATASVRGDALGMANASIAAGHPWLATVQLAPVLRDPKRKTPPAVVLAARAAAGWGGWTEVEHLLAKQSWLDSGVGGEGHELLARAAFARGADSLALRHSAQALAVASDPAARATRLVYLARALDRSKESDSAAATYALAAAALPAIDDWLLLRSAGATRDSARRAALYARVSASPAKERVQWTEAQARERFADPLGAAARYAALGAVAQSLRLRLSVATDTEQRDAVRRELLALVGSRSGSLEARLAVDVLDQGFPALQPDEELIVARSAAVSGPPARALTAFSRARPSGALAPADQLLYGTMLARAGRTRDAAAVLGEVQGPLAGQAAYQRARMTANATSPSALRDVATRFATDTVAASSALYLLADFAVDAGDDSRARATFRELYAKYPTSLRAGDARFSAAIITLASGDAKTAAIELDSVATAAPQSDEVIAARYWAGRAWAAAGNASDARERWKRVAADQPNSYYGAASARRLGEATWTPRARSGSSPRAAGVDEAIARAELLERLGMETEAMLEYDALEESASSSRERMLATALALSDHGQVPQAMRLARKLVDMGEQDARVYRALYPLPDRDQLTSTAAARGLDPALVAGLIRQESGFNPRAVSVAGARGLMQVMPIVGESIARGLRFPVWYPVLLFDSDASLDIGTSHLAASIKQHGVLPRVLAAYNAGGSRVARWSGRPGSADPELFAERIPFAETRDYVRIVARNADVYRALYARELGQPAR